MWGEAIRWSLLPWALFGTLVGLLLVFAQPHRRRFDLFTPLAFAGWSHVIPVYGLGAGVLVAGWRPPVMHLLDGRGDVLARTMAYALLGFAMLGLGFQLPWGRRAGQALARRLPSRSWPPNQVLLPALLLLVASSVISSAALERGVIGYQVRGTVGPFDAALAIAALTSTVTALTLLGLIGFAPAAAWVRGVALSAFAARALLDLLLSGQRGVLLQYLFVLSAAYACSVTVMRWRRAVLLAVGCLLAIAIGMAYGSTFRELKGSQATVGLAVTRDTARDAVRATLARNLFETLGYVRDRLAARIEIISNAAVVVARHRELARDEAAYGLEHDVTRSLLAALVPRVLWPDKPVASDPRAFGELYFGYRNAFAVTPAADLLRNYGVIGIVIGMAVLGLLLRVLYAALIEDQPAVMWRQAAYVSLLLAVSYEGFFGQIVPLLVRAGAVAAACLVGVELVRRGSLAVAGRGEAAPRARRVVIASELMYPEVTSTGYYVSAIARHLAASYPVMALCGQPTYAARGTRGPWRETWHGVSIVRCPGTTFDKNRLIGRLTNVATLGLSSFAAALALLRRGDVVLVVTNPPVLPALVAVACRLRGATYVPVIHDLYPDLLVAVAGVSERSAAARLLRGANRWLFAGAHAVVVVGRDMQARVVEGYPASASKVSVCPNWAEADTVTPLDRRRSPLRAALGLTDAFVLMYAGNLGRAQELETLLAGAERLLAEPSFRLLVVGDGARHDWMAAEVRARGLHNVTMLGPRPRDQQIDFLNAGDVGLVTLVRGMHGVSVPSRLYNFLAAGRPIIGVVEPHSEVDLVIREERVGWSTPPGDVDGFVAAVRDAAADGARLEAMGVRARVAVDRHYSGAAALERYRGLVASVVAGEAGR